MGSDSRDGSVHLHIWDHGIETPWLSDVSMKTQGENVRLDAHTELLGDGTLLIDTVSFVHGELIDLYTPEGPHFEPSGKVRELRLTVNESPTKVDIKLQTSLAQNNRGWANGPFETDARLLVDTWFMGRALHPRAELTWEEGQH
jgi:hypothetical protein